jgi:hypothetical protein
MNPAIDRYESWARQMIDDATTFDRMIEICKFLEGSSPPIYDRADPELDDCHGFDEQGNAAEP